MLSSTGPLPPAHPACAHIDNRSDHSTPEGRATPERPPAQGGNEPPGTTAPPSVTRPPDLQRAAELAEYPRTNDYPDLGNAGRDPRQVGNLRMTAYPHHGATA